MVDLGQQLGNCVKAMGANVAGLRKQGLSFGTKGAIRLLERSWVCAYEITKARGFNRVNSIITTKHGSTSK